MACVRVETVHGEHLNILPGNGGLQIDAITEINLAEGVIEKLENGGATLGMQLESCKSGSPTTENGWTLR